MIWIYVWMLSIPFEWFEFEFECFKSLSNGFKLHSNASNPFQILRFAFSYLIRRVRICNRRPRMLRIPFKWFEFGFECFESFLTVRICIRVLQIPFEWLEFAFEFFNSCIRILRILFEWFQFPFEWLESLSNGENMHLNTSNLVQRVRICFKWLEYAFKCFQSLSNG